MKYIILSIYSWPWHTLLWLLYSCLSFPLSLSSKTLSAVRTYELLRATSSFAALSSWPFKGRLLCFFSNKLYLCYAIYKLCIYFTCFTLFLFSFFYHFLIFISIFRLSDFDFHFEMILAHCGNDKLWRFDLSGQNGGQNQMTGTVITTG